MKDTSIRFLGAAQTVTGSCHIVEKNKTQVMVDCGMFQGEDVTQYNYNDYTFDPKNIKSVIVTHAHLDHCGLLPKLVRHGFKGEIFLTAETAEIVKVILFDSAKLQELNKRLNHDPNDLIYNSQDVEQTISLFKIVPFFVETIINNVFKFEFIPAGHILGSASVYLTVGLDSILFSGDLGRRDQSIIKRFSEYNNLKYKPNYVVMESLYGGIKHQIRDENMSVLADAIVDTVSRNGKVLIPVFALHRAQEMLELLRVYIKRGLITDKIKVYLDSPMAITITDIYTNNNNDFNNHYSILGRDVNYANIVNNKNTFDLNKDRFYFAQLQNIRKSKKSQKLNSKEGGIILAGSGMADGGRMVRHIFNNIEDARTTIVFVGYQAEGTLGRELVDGAKTVIINEKQLNVNATILYLRGFSAHADNDDLLAWLFNFNLDNLKEVILVHADLERSQVFAQELMSKNINAYIPKLEEVRYINE